MSDDKWFFVKLINKWKSLPKAIPQKSYCRFPRKPVLSINSQGIWEEPSIFASGLARIKTNNFLAQCLCLNFWEAQTSVVQYCMRLPDSRLGKCKVCTLALGSGTLGMEISASGFPNSTKALHRSVTSEANHFLQTTIRNALLNVVQIHLRPLLHWLRQLFIFPSKFFILKISKVHKRYRLLR